MIRINKEKVLCNAQKVFGFEKKRKPADFLFNPVAGIGLETPDIRSGGHAADWLDRSPGGFDEVKLAVVLATIMNDINWLKRLVWVIVGGGGAGFYFG